jgi:hypothetical protein
MCPIQAAGPALSPHPGHPLEMGPAEFVSCDSRPFFHFARSRRTHPSMSLPRYLS